MLANKRFWFGMLAVALAFSLTVVGCEEEPTEADFILVNNCENYSVTRIMIQGVDNGTDVNDAVSLTKGQSKTYRFSHGDYKFTIEVAWTGAGTAPTIKQNNQGNTGLENQTFTLKSGIDSERTLNAYTQSEENATPSFPAGTNFSWAYN